MIRILIITKGIKKMTKINITEKESKLMELCFNGEPSRHQHGDNFSEVGPVEIMKILDWTKEQVGGVISSLEQKKLVYSEPADGTVPATVWLTEDGIDTYCDHHNINDL
tara:strand:- start:268 stop:594 length:327 start_codon:yes stop_codon:yes gene_type:complete